MSYAWGKSEYFGLAQSFDARWLLSEDQRELQKELIQLCHSTLRHNAVVSGSCVLFRASMFILFLRLPHQPSASASSPSLASFLLFMSVALE